MIRQQQSEVEISGYRPQLSHSHFSVGLYDERDAVAVQEAVGSPGRTLTPGRSVAIDKSLHVYGTPFFIQAGLPLSSAKRIASFDRLMIAQDTGSAIVGPARADIY